MGHPAFKRAGASILEALGQPSTLDGDACGKVHLARSVRIEMDNQVISRDVATIGNAYLPRKGQALAHTVGDFVLDRKLSDNCTNSRFILR